jgi:hypothetical protein
LFFAAIFRGNEIKLPTNDLFVEEKFFLRDHFSQKSLFREIVILQSNKIGQMTPNFVGLALYPQRLISTYMGKEVFDRRFLLQHRQKSTCFWKSKDEDQISHFPGQKNEDDCHHCLDALVKL